MTIQIQGLERLNKKLDRLEDMQRVMHDPMEAAVVLVHDYIAVAPRKKKGAFTAMATPGQRRYYWWAVKEGIIDHREGVGYVRSNLTVKGWYHKVTRISNGLRGEVGTVNKGTPYVQGPEQQPFHAASGWRTDSEAIEKNRGKINALFAKAIDKELNR